MYNQAPKKYKPINLYLIPGMGTDYRVFDDFDFDESLINPIYMKWVNPHKTKNLKEYAYILVEQIDTTKPFVLLGVSMGGMLAIEICKLHQPAGLILISSAISSSELPFRYKIGRILPLYKGLTDSLLKIIASWKGVYREVDKEEKVHLYQNMLVNTGSSFLKWQIDAVIHWNRNEIETYPQKILRVHGSHDKVIPIKNLKTKIHEMIVKGTHKLVINHFDIISNLVNGFIELEIINNEFPNEPK